MYNKGIHLPFFNKNTGGKLLGGVADVLNSPITSAAVGVLAPGLSGGLAALKKSGVLERLKH
jgi:hypothetical protein